MRNSQGIVFIIGISCLVYIGTFWAIWIGNMDLTILVFGIVSLILLFLNYTFLHSLLYIKKTGTKLRAEIISYDEISEEDFRIYFGERKSVNQLNRNCIAKYNIDSKVKYEFVGPSKIFGCVPGKKTDIYVIKHKVGIRTDYQVVTQKEYVMNYVFCVPYCVMFFCWIFLFIMRGL